jgi:hypothetical protein
MPDGGTAVSETARDGFVGLANDITTSFSSVRELITSLREK